MLKPRFLAASALASSILSYPAALVAQVQAEQVLADPGSDKNDANPANDAPPADTVVITGSRIARPALESAVPLTTLGADELLASGDVSLGDALNDLPSLRSTFSQSNSGRFIGTSGLNFLDLRGLGTARTLVLVNGRRHVTSSPGDFAVDVNTIPQDLLDRVDIVTGGNSAIYGSDAIAGVVNFVLKRDFEGLTLKGQGGISSRGDRGNYFVAGTYGKNFADGRGNIAIAAEYAHSDTLANTQRDYLTGALSGRNQFNLSQNTTTETSAGDGIPDNLFYSGVRNGTISDGGTLTAICGAANLANSARCRPSGVPQRYMFQPDGSLQLSLPTLDFRDITGGSLTTAAGSSNTVGGLGSTLLNTGFLFPKQDRFAINVISHFDVSDAFQPFFEGKYVNIKQNQQGQPSFFQGSIPGFFGEGADLRCNNPFLSAQALSTLQSIGRCANVATGTIQPGRFNVDFGGRGELLKRETYRFVGGVAGRFNEDWNYEISANYGGYEGGFRSLNNLITTNFVNALNAVRNPSGQIVCGINADASTTNDDLACVPINVFGSGAPSQAALAYVNTTSTQREKASEFVVSGFVKGDLSQLFELPGGPVSFVLGSEYRRETAYSKFDDFTQSGATFLNAIPTFDPPSFKVKDAFGELSVPLLADLAFAQELTLSGAGRVSDYKGRTGTVYAYNAGGVYAPIRDIRFRFNYSKSVRAPTLSDLFTPPTQTFGFVADPCDVQNINTGSSNRAANCAAAGVPAGFVNNDARAQTLSLAQAGNPNLEAETARSLTAGVVLQPSFLRGFSLTVDYYRINVSNLIASVSAQQILNNCYDATDLNNQFCSLINRGTDSNFGDPAVIIGTVNFAKQQTRGIDFDAAYQHSFTNGDKVALRGIATYVSRLNNFTDINNPDVPNRQLSELGDPQWSGQASISYEKGPATLFYQVRYIGKQTIGFYEAQNSFNGLPPQNPDQFDRINYPDVFYHNVRLGIDVNDRFNIYGGVDNIGDRKPPLGLTGTTEGSAIFDILGRYMYVGVKANF